MNIRFPGLWGLDFELKNWAFEAFGLRVYWYGIIIALAFLVAVVLALKSCKKYGIEQDTILDGVLLAAPAAIICARIYYVIFSWDQFKDNLLEVFNTRSGGLAVYGGIIGAALMVLIYAKRKKLSFLNLMDFAAPYIVLGQGIGRWGNFINQEAYGTKTTLPWRMNGTVPDSYLNSLGENLDLSKWGVHPTFLYESLWDIAVFLFLLYFRKKKKVEGEVLFMYLILYGAGRFLIEGLRTDSLMIGSIRVSQLLSLLLLIVFAILFVYRRIGRRKEAEDEPVDLGQSQYGALLMKMKEEQKAEEARLAAEAGEAGNVADESTVGETEKESDNETDDSTDGTDVSKTDDSTDDTDGRETDDSADDSIDDTDASKADESTDDADDSETDDSIESVVD